MKRGAILLVAAAIWAGGCEQPVATRFEYEAIRLEVAAKVRGGGEAAVARRDALEAIGRSEAAALYGIDSPQQVMVEVKLLGAGDQSLLETGLWLGGEELLGPIAVENTTPKGPAVSLGFGFGVGGGRGAADHGRDVPSGDRDWRQDESGSSFGAGVGFGFPVWAAGGDRITSVRTTFQYPGLVDLIDGAQLLVTVQLGRTMEGKVVAQPLLLPMVATREAKAVHEQQKGEAPSHVVVGRDGTIVLAGLADAADEPQRNVPVLGDLPLLGRLFASEKRNVERRDLVIFVTPKVIVPVE
jgi:hypothetical protein